MSFEKIVIQQNQQDGSYLELYPKTDAFTKKETLLPTTSTSYDLPESAVPDDVFQNINVRLNLIGSGQAYLALTLVDTNGNKMSGVKVKGFKEGEKQSNDKGVVEGYINANGATFKVEGYADIIDNTATFSVGAGQFVAKTLILNSRNFLKITSSTSYMFSPNVETVDVSVGGAGGAGTSSYRATSGPGYVNGRDGGGEGSVTIKTGLTIIPNNYYSAVVGRSNSGASSFLRVSAAGGATGRGGKGAYASYGNGYNATAGTNSGKTIYSSMTDVVIYGGSGGGGKADWSRVYSGFSRSSGAAPGGGAGGGIGYSLDGANGIANTGGGGGGGAGIFHQEKEDSDYISTYSGGAGGSGVVAIRMHLKNT